VAAFSEKEQAAPTWKKTFGFHPLTAFADHGSAGSGEPLAIMLRPGNAGSNTAADPIEAAKLALAQLPRHLRRRVLIRADSGGGTHEFLTWLTAASRRLHYSVGMTITEEIQHAIGNIPAPAWTPAYDGEGEVRDGAWVAEITGMLDLSGWPAGMRVIVRGERPHPGAQLRFTDIDGHRFTCFATDTKRGQLADLELRHRRRARCEDRGKDPLRQGHRAAEPAAARLRPEPDLVRDRGAGLRTAGVDPDARLRRPGPPLGTQTAAAADLRRRRADRPRRPPPAASHRRPLALGRPDRRRDHPPAGLPVRVTSQNRLDDQEETTRTRGTPPTWRDSRAARHSQPLKNSLGTVPQATDRVSRKIEAKANKSSSPAIHAARSSSISMRPSHHNHEMLL
jgi:Transposase DDE domain group 1